MSFGVEIKCEKPVVMAGEVIFVPWVAEPNNELHEKISQVT